MPNKLNDIELEMVQRFFDMELSDVELEKFQQRMETDASFKKEVDDFYDADFLMNTFESAGIKQEDLPPNLKRKEDDKIKEGNGSLKWLLPLLLLLLVAIGGYYILNQSSETDNEAIYAHVEEYVDKMSENIMRGNDTIYTDTSSLIGVKKTLVDIKRIEEESDKNQFIVGLKTMFDKVEDDDSREVISWWLVKAYNQEGNQVAAKEQLMKISENVDFNSAKKAKELLKDY